MRKSICSVNITLCINVHWNSLQLLKQYESKTLFQIDFQFIALSCNLTCSLCITKETIVSKYKCICLSKYVSTFYVQALRNWSLFLQSFVPTINTEILNQTLCFNSLFTIKRKPIVVKSFILSKLLLLRDIWDNECHDVITSIQLCSKLNVKSNWISEWMLIKKAVPDRSYIWYYLIIDFMFYFLLFSFLFHALFVLGLWAMYAECLNERMFCSVLFYLKTVFDQYVDMVWSF